MLIKRLKSCEYCFFANFCNLSKNKIFDRQIFLKKNSSVQLSDKKGSYLHAIHSGLLKVWYLELEGRERILNFYFPNELVGFESLSRSTYHLELTALSDTIVCSIPFEIFNSLHATGKVSILEMLTLVSKSLDKNLNITHLDARQRVANFVLEIASRLRVGPYPEKFTLPMTREVIGNYLNLAPETVTRIMSLFVKEKILYINKKTTSILNIDYLKNLLEVNFSTFQ